MLVKTCVMFLFTTASRIGETALIEWQHVDLESQTIFLPGENRKNGLGTTKMLTREMVAALQTLGAHIPRGRGLPLFPYIANTSPARCFNKRIAQVCGDNLVHLTSHEIGSHGCVSMLIEAGFTTREISEITGKAEQTIRLYGQSSTRSKLTAVQSVFGDSGTKRDSKETKWGLQEAANSHPIAPFGRP